MDVEFLAEWHKARAAHLKPLDRARAFRGGKDTADSKFHMEAYKLIMSLSENERRRLLIETERDVKIRAIESLEKLGKRLLVESKDIRKMLSEEISDD